MGPVISIGGHKLCLATFDAYMSQTHRTGKQDIKGKVNLREQMALENWWVGLSPGAEVTGPQMVAGAEELMTTWNAGKPCPQSTSGIQELVDGFLAYIEHELGCGVSLGAHSDSGGLPAKGSPIGCPTIVQQSTVGQCTEELRGDSAEGRHATTGPDHSGVGGAQRHQSQGVCAGGHRLFERTRDWSDEKRLTYMMECDNRAGLAWGEPRRCG